MGVFEAQDFDHHETVAFFEDKASGLKAIIAIHSTALGPACGGTRMYPYANGDEALTDVLRLSRGMSYKSAMADLPLGGGKAVIIGNPAHRHHRGASCWPMPKRSMRWAGATSRQWMSASARRNLPVIARGTKYAAGFDQPGKTGGDSGPAMTTWAPMSGSRRR